MDLSNCNRILCCLILVLCSATIVLTNSIQRECSTDSHCANGGNLFCHEFQCTSCVPCSAFNRQGPAKSADGSRCAASAESCGPCSPGYQPEEIKSSLRFLMRTYRCEKKKWVPFRIEILFGSLMIVAVAIVLGILFKVWRDTKLNKESKQVIVETDSVELVHTSCCFYENSINVDIGETEYITNSPNHSPREDPLSDSGSTVVLNDNSDDDKPIASFSSGISAGSYELHESAINQESHSVRISNTNLVVVPCEQGLVKAVPIGRYHIPYAENDKQETAVQVIELPTDQIREATESNHWIWSSNSVSSSEAHPASLYGHIATASLVRCLSRDNLAQSCPSVGKRRNSDPSLVQNSYENLHISLGSHRTVPATCAATSDGVLIDESHQAKVISFSSAPDMIGIYQPIYPELPVSPTGKTAAAQVGNGFPTTVEAQRTVPDENASSDRAEQLSAHILLSSEDTVFHSARTSACFASHIFNSLNKAKSQPLPTSGIVDGPKRSLSCPHLSDNN